MFNITYQENGSRRKRLDFDGRVCSIGRDKRNNLVIHNRKVEKIHAEIVFEDGLGCFLIDKSSFSGTWLNNQKINSKASVDAQDEIIVGDTKIWVHPIFSAKKVKLESVEAKDIIEDKHISASHNPDEGEGEAQEEIMRLGAMVHERLIGLMDLRRKEVHKMSDDELRRETEELIDQIFLSMQDVLPVGDARDIIRTNVLNEAVGLGPLELFLNDDSITEIMVNNYKEVFVERAGKLTKSEHGFSGDHAVMSVIERIITPLGRRIDESSPLVDARLKDGSRVNAIIPPLAIKGPSLTIRKFSKKKLGFEDLIQFGSINKQMVEFLRVCVAVSHKNIVVSGGTGSGKTTLLNVLSSFIPDSERIVTVEDAAELKLDQPNLVSLESKPANVEGKGQIAIRDLVKNSLRMRPDRIVVGECRGGEALDMLQAMNTGHDGSLTTAHANTPRDLISRLEVMVLMAGIDLPVTAIREQIASAVDLIVQQTRFPCGTRKVTKITEVVGVESGTVQLQDIFVYKRKGYGPDGKVMGDFEPCGFIPTFYEELKNIGTDLDISIFQNQGEKGGFDERF